METVLLTNCGTSFEADVIKSVLDGAGIPCMIVDHKHVAMWSFQGPDTIGGVRIYVFESMLEEARNALETSHDAASEAAFEKAAEEAPPLEQMEEDEE